MVRDRWPRQRVDVPVIERARQFLDAPCNARCARPPSTPPPSRPVLYPYPPHCRPAMLPLVAYALPPGAPGLAARPTVELGSSTKLHTTAPSNTPSRPPPLFSLR